MKMLLRNVKLLNLYNSKKFLESVANQNAPIITNLISSSSKCYDGEPAPSSMEKPSKPYRQSTSQAVTMMDIGARSIFNEDHDILRESVRKFFHDEVLPYHDQWESEGQVSRELWLKAGEQGLLGTDTPEEHGGIGGTFKDAAIIIEEQSYISASGPGFSLHSQIVLPYITHYGSPEQIQKFVPDLVAGRKISSIAMSEPGAGSDLQGVRTRAVKDGDDWILNGSKTFITNGFMSDVCIVVAVTDPNAKSVAHGISLFLVENEFKGYRKGKKLRKMGLKAQDTAELFFEDVRMPSSALLGKANHGFYYLMNELPQERLLIGIGSCANSEWQFEETRKYVLQRKAFGKTLSNIQTIQHKLAEMKTDICVGRAFTDQCIDLHNIGKLDGGMASMSKLWMSDLQNRIAAQCVQLHGGWGYMWEYPISRAYVDARVQTIYGGSNEIMKELIQRQVVGDKRL